MTPELRYLSFTAILTGALWIPVVIGYGKARGALKPGDYVVAPTAPLPDWVNRANRAHMNAVEAFAPFAAMVLVGHALGVSTSVTAYSAAIFFTARLVHAAVHISGFKWLMARTLIFSVGWCAFMALSVEILRKTM